MSTFGDVQLLNMVGSLFPKHAAAFKVFYTIVHTSLSPRHTSRRAFSKQLLLRCVALALVGHLSVAFPPVEHDKSAAEPVMREITRIGCSTKLLKTEVSFISSSQHRLGKAPWAWRCSRPIDACAHLVRFLLIFPPPPLLFFFHNQNTKGQTTAVPSATCNFARRLFISIWKQCWYMDNHLKVFLIIHPKPTKQSLHVWISWSHLGVVCVLRLQPCGAEGLSRANLPPHPHHPA